MTLILIYVGECMRKIRPLKKRILCAVKGYSLLKEKHGELNCIHCVFHIDQQTFPVNKSVLKTKV